MSGLSRCFKARVGGGGSGAIPASSTVAEVLTFSSPTSTGLQPVDLDPSIWRGTSPKLLLFFGSTLGPVAIGYGIETTAPNETHQLPLVNSGVYNCYVDFGDGGKPVNITSYNDPLATHTYAVAGTYSIRIFEGQCPWFSFNNGGDRLQVRSIDVIQPDLVGQTDCSGMWYGCSNATDCLFTEIVWPNVTSTANLFRSCNKLNLPITRIEVDESTNCSLMFQFCEAAELPVVTMSMKKATRIDQMFQICRVASLPLETVDLSACTNANSFLGNSTQQVASGIDVLLEALDANGLTSGSYSYDTSNNTHLDSARSPEGLAAIASLGTTGSDGKLWTRSGSY